MKFAIIGCGIIAHSHAKALDVIEGEELYAVCYIIDEKADAFKEEYGAEKVYYTSAETVADPEVDVVIVCVPSGTHGDICIEAAQAGKDIVCEKPLEITPGRIDEIIRVVEETGVKMQCIFQRRLMPVAIAAREAIQAGKLGRICLAHADLKYYRDQPYYDSAGWRGTWEQDGGGALMNQGVHGVDLILWMIGDELESLYGQAKTLARDIEVEDTAAVLINLKGGALVTIDAATTAYPGFSTAFAIHGEKGSIEFNDEGLVSWSFIDESDAPPRPEAGKALGGSGSNVSISASGHVGLLTDMMEAIRDDREPMIPPRDARDAVQVICSIYKATEEKAIQYFN